MWFSVRLLFESEVDDGKAGAPLVEESIRLIQAADADEAERKAENLGGQEVVEYRNHEGADVKWKFIEVLEVQDLCEEQLYDGMEVYSRMSWKSEGDPRRGQ